MSVNEKPDKKKDSEKDKDNSLDLATIIEFDDNEEDE